MRSAPLDISAGDPYAACPPIGAGVNYPDAEVEPFVDVRPTNPDHVLAVYQQDRYSNGGAKGIVSSASFDGGLTWMQRALPADTVCTGGKYDRASDPWISFGPDGVAHAMSLVTDADPPAGFGDNGMAYNRSIDGGLTWEPAKLLIEDTDPRFLNDKNSITADPNDADYVYAVWDRLQNAKADTKLGPAENRVGLGFKGPIYFARTTNGGNSWEPARKIWESGANKQALGDQIAVLPAGRGGDLLDFFTEFLNASDRGDHFPRWLSFIRSTDKGARGAMRSASTSSSQARSWSVGTATARSTSSRCPAPTQPRTAAARSARVTSSPTSRSTRATATSTPCGWTFASTAGSSSRTTTTSPSRCRPTAAARGRPRSRSTRRPADEPNYDQQAFTPAVDVAGNGTVTVSYYDFRNNTESAASLDTDYFAVHCHASCGNPASWVGNEMRITPTSFDIRKAPYARGYFVGDYMGLASARNDFLAVFGQAFTQNNSNQYVSRLSP